MKGTRTPCVLSLLLFWSGLFCNALHTSQFSVIFCKRELQCSSVSQLILRNIIKIVATMQMSNFKAKMHQIIFRLGLRARLRCSLSQTPIWISGGLLSRGGKRSEGLLFQRRGERGHGSSPLYFFLRSQRLCEKKVDPSALS